MRRTALVEAVEVLRALHVGAEKEERHGEEDDDDPHVAVPLVRSHWVLLRKSRRR